MKRVTKLLLLIMTLLVAGNVLALQVSSSEKTFTAVLCNGEHDILSLELIFQSPITTDFIKAAALNNFKGCQKLEKPWTFSVIEENRHNSFKVSTPAGPRSLRVIGEIDRGLSIDDFDALLEVE
ncbi:hypothetical protein ACEUCJ_20035 [Aeromonas rivipollensis]|uniref:hypothetical protein n=1 Tax=Aeromonas rivipollensis TaxID=948519 RepID=UPI0038D00A3B